MQAGALQAGFHLSISTNRIEMLTTSIHLPLSILFATSHSMSLFVCVFFFLFSLLLPGCSLVNSVSKNYRLFVRVLRGGHTHVALS